MRVWSPSENRLSSTLMQGSGVTLDMKSHRGSHLTLTWESELHYLQRVRAWSLTLCSYLFYTKSGLGPSKRVWLGPSPLTLPGTLLGLCVWDRNRFPTKTPEGNYLPVLGRTLFIFGHCICCGTFSHSKNAWFVFLMDEPIGLFSPVQSVVTWCRLSQPDRWANFLSNLASVFVIKLDSNTTREQD